jgi:carboxyl-terminal processing protease
MQLNRIRPWLLLLSLTTALLAGCARNNEVTPDPAAITGVQLNDSIYSFLKEWYLWNDQLPAVNTALYNTPQEFVRALRLQPFDRWSYIEDTQTFNQYFVDGQFAGHGFGMRLDGDRNLRVSFVYRDSPMGRQGVTRGYKILRINGQDVSGLIATNTLSQALGEDKVGVQNRFLVEDLSGGQREFTIPKENVTINAVLHYEVKEVADKKVGYLAYNTFIDKSKAELDEVFRHFQQQGIQELVLDVRYNGGGSLGAAQYLSGLIGASRAGTGAFATLTYNSQKQASNRPYFFCTQRIGC